MVMLFYRRWSRLHAQRASLTLEPLWRGRKHELLFRRLGLPASTWWHSLDTISHCGNPPGFMSGHKVFPAAASVRPWTDVMTLFEWKVTRCSCPRSRSSRWSSRWCCAVGSGTARPTRRTRRAGGGAECGRDASSSLIQDDGAESGYTSAYNVVDIISIKWCTIAPPMVILFKGFLSSRFLFFFLWKGCIYTVAIFVSIFPWWLICWSEWWLNN